MSEGLYSMEAKDFDKTLDLTKVKPYGDTMNDGKVQLSFTLPVPCGAEAVEAAKQLIRKMGMENPQVVFYKELTPGFTFFNCYGSCSQTVDYQGIYVPKVESSTMDMYETDAYTTTFRATRIWQWDSEKCSASTSPKTSTTRIYQGAFRKEDCGGWRKHRH